MVKRAEAVFVSEDGTRNYRAQIKAEVNPFGVDEKLSPTQFRSQREWLMPGHSVPDGKYIRQPYVFNPLPEKYVIKGGEIDGPW